MAVKVRERNGKWWVFIDHQGKRKAKCIGRSKRAAHQAADKIEAALTLGQLNLQEKRRPFSAYFREWLDTYVKAHCKESTLDKYEKMFRLYLAPVFGDRDLGTITLDDVRKLVYGELAKGKRKNYVSSIIMPMGESLSHAVEDGLIATNPVRGAMRRVKADPNQEKKADPLTREELTHLLKTCLEYFPAHYPFVLLLARTGLRLGEAVVLMWEVLDFNGRFLEVQHTLYKGQLTTPKGRRRRVDMSKQLTETLKTLSIERKKETLRRGWGEVPRWVFPNEVGSFIEPNNFRNRVWYALLAKAGLRRIRIHDLRHTFASLLIEQGAPLPGF